MVLDDFKSIHTPAFCCSKDGCCEGDRSLGYNFDNKESATSFDNIQATGFKAVRQHHSGLGPVGSLPQLEKPLIGTEKRSFEEVVS